MSRQHSKEITQNYLNRIQHLIFVGRFDMDLFITILISVISGAIGAIFTILTEGYRTKLKIISKIRETQFTLYSELWVSLYDLRLAGDKLWQEATKTNLQNFEKQLQETELKINRSSLLIEENDIRDLRIITDKFLDFRVGKRELIRLRELRQNKKLYQEVNLDMVHDSTVTNEGIKKQYDNLISKIEKSLRNQLRTV